MNRSTSYFILLITTFVIACGEPSDSIEPIQPAQPFHWYPAAKALPEPCPDRTEWATQQRTDGVLNAGWSSGMMHGQPESMRLSSEMAYKDTDQDEGDRKVIRLESGDLSAFAMPSVRATQGMDLGSTKTIPAIEGLRITTLPRLDAIYDYDEVIEIEVEYDEPVQVTGRPYLLLQLRIPGTEKAYYEHGSGTERLYFQYRVSKGDWDNSGLCVFAGQINLNGGAIYAVSYGAKASLHHTGLPDDLHHRVNGYVGG